MKKILFSLGSILAVSMPIVTTVSLNVKAKVQPKYKMLSYKILLENNLNSESISETLLSKTIYEVSMNGFNNLLKNLGIKNKDGSFCEISNTQYHNNSKIINKKIDEINNIVRTRIQWHKWIGSTLSIISIAVSVGMHYA